METTKNTQENDQFSNKNSQKLNKWSRIYQIFIIYLPVFLLLSLIVLIYITYLTNYLYLLVFSNTFDHKSFPFISTTSLSSARTKGIILFITITILITFLLISMIRVVIMDPGYLPDPLDLEIKLVHKLTYKSFVPDTDKEKQKRKFTKEFSSIVQSSPLTFNEVRETNKKINYYFSDNLFFETNEPEFKVRELYNLKTEEVFRTDEKEEFFGKEEPNLDDLFENFKSIDISKISLCNACLRWKVDRSHHCRQCGKCVLKMDHHCPWLANCIGFRNYKYFCLIAIYGVMSSLIVSSTFWESVYHYYSKGSLIISSFVIYVYMCNFGLMLFAFWLLFYNWNLVFSNMSLIEKCDKDKFNSSKKMWINEYDQGIYRNFISVFGKNPLVWFLPGFANYEGEGLVYLKNTKI